MVSALVNGFMAYAINVYIDVNTTQADKSDTHKCIKLKKVSSWLVSAVSISKDICTWNPWFKSLQRQFFYITFSEFYTVKIYGYRLVKIATE